MDEIQFIDKSGDKEFFTIVPDIVINHSTAIERALYLEIRRFAGSNGKCFATKKTMMTRLGVSDKAFNKALKYLLKNEWISFSGFTEGKTRPIKTYIVNDIWLKNSDYYRKKIGVKSTLSIKKEKDRRPKHTKIGVQSTVEEDTPKVDKTPATQVKTMKTYLEPDLPERAVDYETGKDVSLTLPRKDIIYRDIILWAENRRGAKFPNWKKQLSAIKMLRVAGIQPPQIQRRWMDMEKDDFWRNAGFDFMSVMNSFNKKK